MRTDTARLGWLAAAVWLTLLVSIWPGAARGQAASAPVAVGCHPASIPFAGARIALPWGTGSDAVAVSTDKASGLFAWCPQPTPAGSWNIAAWQWNLTGAALPLVDLRAAYGRVLAASSPASAIDAEAARLRVPLTDDMQRYEVRRLVYTACLTLTTFPVPVNLPAPAGPWRQGVDFLPKADGTPFCGLPPVAPPPPPPPVVAYVVTGSAAYPVNPDGSRSILSIATKPTLGSPCDCVAKQIISAATGARYCAVTIPGVTQLVVAGCSVKK
jgi:hypothetical protein